MDKIEDRILIHLTIPIFILLLPPIRNQRPRDHKDTRGLLNNPYHRYYYHQIEPKIKIAWLNDQETLWRPLEIPRDRFR